jgi:hypothetical protein
LSTPARLLQKILSQVIPLSVVRHRLCFSVWAFKVRIKAVAGAGVIISVISEILVSIRLI